MAFFLKRRASEYRLPVPLLGFVACSGTGKTTLLTRLIPQLKARGCVARRSSTRTMILPSTSRARIRNACVSQVQRRWCWPLRIALSGSARAMDTPSPACPELLEFIDVTAVDVVLVEGFRHEPFPKIEVYRSGRGQPLLCVGDDTIIAVAVDSAPVESLAIPCCRSTIRSMSPNL